MIWLLILIYCNNKYFGWDNWERVVMEKFVNDIKNGDDDNNIVDNIIVSWIYVVDWVWDWVVECIFWCKLW